MIPNQTCCHRSKRKKSYSWLRLIWNEEMCLCSIACTVLKMLGLSWKACSKGLWLLSTLKFAEKSLAMSKFLSLSLLKTQWPSTIQTKFKPTSQMAQINRSKLQWKTTILTTLKVRSFWWVQCGSTNKSTVQVSVKRLATKKTDVSQSHSSRRSAFPN